jgi:hypothetical protein
MYADCAAATGRGLLKNLWVVLLPMLYGVVGSVAAIITAPLGIIGGFIMGLVEAALFASMLYMIDEIVSGNPVRPRELVMSLRRYLWPVINVMFVFWIAGLIAGAVLGNMQNGGIITIALMVVLFILLNATPEAIYQKRMYGGLATLQESIRFIQRHWIEWFIPNIAFGAALYFGLPRLMLFIPLGLGMWGTTLLLGLLEGLILFPIMVFRGHLFHALDTGLARRRAAMRFRP